MSFWGSVAEFQALLWLTGPAGTYLQIDMHKIVARLPEALIYLYLNGSPSNFKPKKKGVELFLSSVVAFNFSFFCFSFISIMFINCSILIFYVVGDSVKTHIL